MERLALVAALCAAFACSGATEADVARPLILYENLLEDATLTASTTATGYSVDSLKTRQTTDRWTSQAGTEHTITAQLAEATNPTAWAMTRHDLTRAAGGGALGTETFDTVESPLATGWTDVGDEALQATGGYATDASQTALTPSSTVRHYVRSAGDAWFGVGQGYVEAEIQFSTDDVDANRAGVSARDSSTGAFIAATLQEYSDQVFVWFYGAGGSLITGYSQAISGITSATDYTLKLVVDDTNAYVYVDGVLKQTQGWTGDMPGGFSADQQGIFQYSSDPAQNVAQWDNFSAGLATTDATSVVAPVILEGSADGATWTYQKLYWVNTAGTFIGRIDDGSSLGYWRWRFPQTASRALMIGCLSLGRRLDFTESMAQGFDPKNRRLMVHQSRSNAGEVLPSVVRYQTQPMALRFGPAGLSTTDFFEQTGTPSWEEFIDDYWGFGRPFWYAWDIVQRPRDMWFCMLPDKARTGSPFITAIRRGWSMDFEALVEGVGSS